MNRERTLRFYRSLVRCYPRGFRDEYGADMALLFGHQLDDEPASQVWARGLVDLAITIPARHLEAHMHRPPNPTVPLIYAAISFSGVVFGVLSGSRLGLTATGLVVGVVAGVLAFASWWHTRTLTAERPATSHWWQMLLGGAAMSISTIIGLNVVGEVPDGWWGPMIIALLAGILTTALGVILGVSRLATNRSRRTTG